MDEEFAARLARLRMAKGVSARDMSLSIGQSAGYINNIENGYNLPSMRAFFYICEYFGITPSEFFDTKSNDPKQLKDLIENLKQLNEKQFDSVSAIVQNLLQK